MALRKVAPAALWQTRKKGTRSDTLTLAYDAGADQFYIAESESAAAYLVLDSGDGQYTVNDTRGGTMARISSVGAAPARILE